jgi:hypothetical protein
MYGVSEQLDLTPFVGTTLDYIGISISQVLFLFSGNPWTEKDRSVAAEGYWEMRDNQSVVIDKATENDNRDIYKIHCLLSRTVVKTKINPPESFALVFDNGWTLTFVDDSNGYENHHITMGDIEIHI